MLPAVHAPALAQIASIGVSAEVVRPDDPQLVADRALAEGRPVARLLGPIRGRRSTLPPAQVRLRETPRAGKPGTGRRLELLIEFPAN